MQVVAVLFKIRLPLLEQGFFDLCEGFVVVVAVGVRPLENLPALNHRLAALLQEVELLGRVTLSLVQQDALLFDYREKLDCELARTIVVRISFVVPHVPLELGLRILALLLLLLETRVFFLLFIQIALVIAACCRAMIFPVAHANPAELMAALRAGHVIAPLVFLDVLAALGTNFRVCCNPCHIFRLRRSFLIPELGGVTIARLVRVLPAYETEDSAAFALDLVEHAARVFSLAAELALDVGAPLDVFVVVSERLA